MFQNWFRLYITTSSFNFVPRTGLEPAPQIWDQHLKLACLPIPPPRHCLILSLSHKDSNLEFQNQNLTCYQLHYGTIFSQIKNLTLSRECVRCWIYIEINVFLKLFTLQTTHIKLHTQVIQLPFGKTNR